MAFSEQTQKHLKRLSGVAQSLKLQFARRDTAIDLMSLALLCREHVLLLGPPGTAKSELVSLFSKGVHAKHFQYLLTRFTEPSELFGPVDLKAFEQGRYQVSTEGMLPTAQVAFLDEVFQASSAILNTLLSLIHERLFHNGSSAQAVPLITLFGASNNLPDDPTLRAFSDRFVLRVEVEPVPDESLGDLLELGWQMEVERMASKTIDTDSLITPEQLNNLYPQLQQVSMGDLQAQYQEIIRQLRASGVTLSDRRIVKGLKLIRGAAMLKGRDQADERDLWPLNHIWSSSEDQSILHQVVQTRVDAAGGPALNKHRQLQQIVEEFELLQSRAAGLKGDGAFTAHLTALGQIRRELLLHYASEKQLLQKVNGVIQQVMDGMRVGG